MVIRLGLMGCMVFQAACAEDPSQLDTATSAHAKAEPIDSGTVPCNTTESVDENATASTESCVLIKVENRCFDSATVGSQPKSKSTIDADARIDGGKSKNVGINVPAGHDLRVQCCGWELANSGCHWSILKHEWMSCSAAGISTADSESSGSASGSGSGSGSGYGS